MAMNAGGTPILDADTAPLPERDRFEYFCDALCEVYLGIQPERTTARPFDADVLAYDYGHSVLSRIRACGHGARRDRRLLKAKSDDALFLNICTDAACDVEQDDRRSRLAPGALVVLDNASPFHLNLDSRRRFRLYSLRIPRDFAGPAPGARAVAKLDDAVRETPAGLQLRAQSHLMIAEFEAGRPAVAAAMAGAVISLLAELLSLDGAGVGERTPERLSACKHAALDRLTDPDLTIRDLARASGVSVRTIQLDFSATGQTFTQWLSGERLDLARRLLGGPASHTRSVEAVALACGFSDPSHFHRAYRKRFVVTPGASRR